jgi:tetratricopeptide (TPR) repeat protein
MSLSLSFAQAFERALGFQQAGDWAQAEVILDQLLRDVPGQAHALYLLGLVRSGQRRFAEAAGLIEQAVAANPAEKLFLHHLQEVYRRLGRVHSALAAGQRAVAAFPGDAMLWANLAAIHRDRLEVAQAVAAAERALSLQADLPEAHMAMAETLLLAGEFERGWAAYEWRFALSGAGQLMAPTESPAWDGAPLAGTLLLVADQGFGDVIQFARYIPVVAARCGALAIVSAAELQPLLRQIWPSLMIYDRWESGVACAAWVALSSLPRWFGMLPAPAAYLHADPARVDVWRAQLGSAGLQVGIVWAGSPEHPNDRQRSTVPATFAPLAAVPGVRLVSLQRGVVPADAAVFDAGSALADFADTMCLLGAIDVLITVDTAMAHLAGAMGRPVWILLPYAPDWRWLLDRSDSPWYPSARLFRQPAPGDWGAMMKAVVGALEGSLAADEGGDG